MHRSAARCIPLLLIAILLAGSPAPRAAAPQASQVRAAYLVNFIRYIAWPAPTTHQLCLVGDDEVADWLERNQNRSGVAVRRLTETGELERCTVLFLGRDSTQTRDWLSATREKAILTVSEQGGFLQKGGVINLVTHNNTLRFEINLDNALRARLQVSSRLLALAQHVEGGPQ